MSPSGAQWSSRARGGRSGPTARAGSLGTSKTLTAQENRARAVVAGDRRPRGTRFVTTRKGDQVLDDKALARARRLEGLKGYVTNIPATVMPASEVIASYHELWHVEQSLAHEHPRPAGQARLPPHPRRHPGPPDRRDGIPGRRPPPPADHGREHQTTRTRTGAPPGSHHHHQRTPNNRTTHHNPTSTTAHQRPKTAGTLNWHDSGPRMKEFRSSPMAWLSATATTGSTTATSLASTSLYASM